MDKIGISIGHSNLDCGAIAINGQEEHLFNSELVAEILDFKTNNFEWFISDWNAENLPYPQHIWQTVRNINESDCIGAIEIHHNSSLKSHVRGGMVIHWDTSEQGKVFAEYVSKEMSIIDDTLFDWGGLRYIWKRQKYDYEAGTVTTLKHLKRRIYFLGRTLVPALIIEPCYISNVDDIEWINKNRIYIARAIRTGCERWVESLKKQG